jgi:glycosyltransferase involved in cell wall biosynthesis
MGIERYQEVPRSTSRTNTITSAYVGRHWIYLPVHHWSGRREDCCGSGKSAPCTMPWSQIAAKRTDARLVLTGPINRHYPPPERDDVVYLGNLTHRQTALLFNALDVGVIYLRDTRFGRYCFPQKAYEMIACRLPIAAADIGAMPTLFSNPCNLYRADDSASLAQTIISNLDEPAVPDQAICDWHEIVSELDRHLRSIFKTNKRGAECKR